LILSKKRNTALLILEHPEPKPSNIGPSNGLPLRWDYLFYWPMIKKRNVQKLG